MRLKRFLSVPKSESWQGNVEREYQCNPYNELLALSFGDISGAIQF